jgi:hypothetical protein
MRAAGHLDDVAPFARWTRWAAIGWLVGWFPVYWHTWGASNFIHLCDIAVVLTCVGFVFGNALLISSQAVSSLIADLAWSLDVISRVISGHHWIRATDYMFDPHFPLIVRLLSCFHFAMPAVLLLALKYAGYDRRGFALQCAIAAVVLPLSRLAGPEKNYNFAFRDPFFNRAFGPAIVHLAVIYVSLVCLYAITHAALRSFFRPLVARQD